MNSYKKVFSLLSIFILTMYSSAFALSNIELTTVSGASVNIGPTFPTTTINLPAGTTSFTIPISDDNFHYVGEYGIQTTTNENRSTVSLDQELCDPVVVGSSESNVDGTPERTKRFRNLDEDSFQVKVDAGLDGTFNGSTPVHWTVFEKGSHTLIDGTKVSAGSNTVSLVRGDACRDDYQGTLVNYPQAFDDTNPVILYAISSDNDTTWVEGKVYGPAGGRTTEPTSTSMYMTMERSFNNCTHDPEVIDRLGFDSTHLTSNGIEFDTNFTLNSVACCAATGYPMSYDSAFSSVPQNIIVSQSGEDGGNGSYAVKHTSAASTTQSRISVDEDSSGSRGHAAESIGQAAFSNSDGYFVHQNTLSHVIGGTDAGEFTLVHSTGSVASGIQLTLDSPPTCGDETYTIIVQSTDDHHCNPKASNKTTITINYIFPDTDGDGVEDCQDNCPTVANPGQQDADSDSIGDACDPQTCGNSIVETGEECDDNNTTDGDGCSSTCETEYCRDDAPFNAKDAGFTVTNSNGGTVTGTSSYSNVKLAVCYEESDGTKNVYYTTTDGAGNFTYTSPDRGTYQNDWVNVGVMLHDTADLDIDHHSVMMWK